MSDSHAVHGEVVTDPAAHAAHEAVGHKFEKIELTEFQDADRGAGQHIGILLAFLFVVLLVLMSSATLWTYIHQNVGHDPHALPTATNPGGH
jgi:hypothetical protein